MFKKFNLIQILSVIILGLSISAVFFPFKQAQFNVYGAAVCPASWYGQEISATAYEYDPDPADGCRPCFTTGYVRCDSIGNLSYRTITSYSGTKATNGSWGVKSERCSPYNVWQATESRDSGYISSAGDINVSYFNYPQMKFLSPGNYSYFSRYVKSYCNQTDWVFPQYTADGYLDFNLSNGNLTVRNSHRDGSWKEQSVAFSLGVPPPPPLVGTINIASNNSSSSWTIAGPEIITGSGISAAYTDKPEGIYTIVWNNVAGYTTPSTESQTLIAGGAITFIGNYQLISPPPPPPPPAPTSSPSSKFKLEEIIPE
ncbi:MAG: hypothetical protein US36_C0017G0023 [Candidatus Wolfebacteria bacterium GW2011_GWC1_37_10]|nr:MAG: hypothetical protein US36_C0017G0023 [Candidatus Wolfebacteria bacterium GW2011_GWC1_37_10]